VPVTDPRIRTLLQLRLWQPGQGDPTISYPFSGWYDVLAESWPFGASSLTAAGDRKLEYIKDVGLVCRPFLALQDTRLTDFSVSSTGTWAERRLATGTPRKYRLAQLNTTADTVWSASSNYSLLANPDVAFSLILPDPPADADATTYPPYVRITLGVDAGGTGQWAIDYADAIGARLLQFSAGSWSVVAELPELQARANDALGEAFIFVRCLRNRICISTDFGRTYAIYGSDTNPVAIRQGKVSLAGQNRQVVFGVHQLAYVAGVYTSPTHPYLPPFRGSATPDFTASRYAEPASTDVAIADASVFASGYLRYAATLTPSSSGTTPFAMHKSPELYAVLMALDPVTASGAGAYELYGDGRILGASIDKPAELDGATLNLQIIRDAQTQHTWAFGRWAKAQLLAAEMDEAGAAGVFTERFTGYVRSVNVRQAEYNKSNTGLVIDNSTVRLRDKEWTEFDNIPLGGQSLNSALDDILASEGIPLNTSYRQWHLIGDLFTLPSGRPEDPFEWPRRGERKWETAERIAGYAGLELGLTEDGVFATVPQETYSLTVTRVLEAVATGELKHGIQDISVSADASQSATAVLVYGNAEDGGRLFAYAVDSQAELNTTSDRFSNIGRCLVQEELPGTVNAAMLSGRARFLAYLHFGNKIDATVRTPQNLEATRRETDRFSGVLTGPTDAEKYVVLTASHDLRPALVDSSTSLTLRRITQ
jgi:hypothetical protein